MDARSLILLFFSFSLPLVFLFLLRRRKPPVSGNHGLPPGPLAFPVIGNLIWLRRSFSEIEGVLRSLRARYGPIVTLHLGSRRAIFVSDGALVHKILVQHGAAFADRPPAPFTDLFINSSQRNIINSAHYGATWRVLRRNLAAEVLHPSRVKHCAGARERVLKILLGGLRERADAGEPVVVVESFQYAMFCLLVFMCFGEMLEERGVREVEKVQRDFLLYLSKLTVFNIFPGFARFVFGNRLRTIRKLRHGQEATFIPLIRARRRLRDEKGAPGGGENTLRHSYVDSLLDLQIPGDGGENRSLTDGEIVSLCSEFLNAGSDTTATSLQWIMANLVKHRHIQAKLYEEIASVVGRGEQAREEKLGRMPYLKAVVMEGLRRHPPGHFLLPHAAVEETAVDGYVIPRDASLNFVVTEINWDEGVWERPMEFRPERFLAGGEGEGVDITGSKGVKMMPFGVGRRICPGLALALLHLEYFVANLVWAFEWTAVAGEDVDLAEKTEFTVVLKHPLKARISPRRPGRTGT